MRCVLSLDLDLARPEVSAASILDKVPFMLDVSFFTAATSFASRSCACDTFVSWVCCLW